MAVASEFSGLTLVIWNAPLPLAPQDPAATKTSKNVPVRGEGFAGVQPLSQPLFTKTISPTSNLRSRNFRPIDQGVSLVRR